MVKMAQTHPMKSKTETSPQPGKKRKKLARTALTLREKAMVKSFCEAKISDCNAQGKLMPSQEFLRREVATQFGWSCGRSTLSRIISMDWKVLRGGNAVRNLDMKRHRRPLFPAFEADLVKFIRAHMEEEGDNGSVLNDMEESQVVEKHCGVSALPVTENKGTYAIGDTEDGGQGRPLTEALILEEAQRLKKVHGVSDEMLVLSVGWLARLKHRYCIRLRKPAWRSSNCSSPLHHQFELATGGSAESMVSCNSGLITSSAPETQNACKQVIPRQPVIDATMDIASNNVDMLSPSPQHTGNVGLTCNFIQSAMLKRTVMCSAQWYRRDTANSSTTTTELLRQIPENIRDLACSCQGSATCDTLFGGIAGLRVAVVGFGCVVEAFLAAALVGAGGFVTCVEASLANVYLAEQAAETFCLTTMGLPSVNMKFIVCEDGGMPRSSSLSAAVSEDFKDLQGQIDIAICNCSIQSLEFPASKNAMLKLAYSLLKVGGELRAIDLVSSRRLSPCECEEIRLAVKAIVGSEGAARTHESSKQLEKKLLLGAPYIGDLQRLFRALGGDAEIRSVSCNEAEAKIIDVAVASLLPSLAAANNIKFRRVTFHVFRLHNVENPCEDYGQTAVFNGYDIQNKATGGEDLPSSYQLDDDWSFRRGVCTPIDGNTAQILQSSWMQRYFSVSGDCSRHLGPFVTSASSMNGSPVSQQAASAPKAAVADQPSSTISSSRIDPLDMINI